MAKAITTTHSGNSSGTLHNTVEHTCRSFCFQYAKLPIYRVQYARITVYFVHSFTHIHLFSCVFFVLFVRFFSYFQSIPTLQWFFVSFVIINLSLELVVMQPEHPWFVHSFLHMSQSNKWVVFIGCRKNLVEKVLIIYHIFHLISQNQFKMELV